MSVQFHSVFRFRLPAKNNPPVGKIDWSKVKFVRACEPAPGATLNNRDVKILKADPLFQFLTDCTEAVECEKVRSLVLHEAFCSWCERTGHSCWSVRGFTKAMEDRGFTKTVMSGAGVYWVGLRIKAEVQQ